jgi:flagellar biosynthetic protein FlhB
VSEGPDQESKTEETTEKRLTKAYEKGDVPISREAATLAFLCSLFVALTYFVGEMGAQLVGTLALFLEKPADWRIDSSADVLNLANALSVRSGAAIGPIVAVIAAAGVGVALVQSPLHMAYDKIKPDPSRISLAKGWKRLFSKQSVIELVKAILKLSLIGSVAVVMVTHDWLGFAPSIEMDPQRIPSRLVWGGGLIISVLALAAVVIVALDVAFVRFTWRRNLRMTRQEVKDEHRQSEGDPAAKARRRSIARNRSRKRMLASVPEATLIIANPTHFAVALRYVESKDAAPRVVAKGQDHIALAIRRLAEERGIPVIEDKALARTLYSRVEVDQTIPAEFYKAVADILIFLQKRGQYRRQPQQVR